MLQTIASTRWARTVISLLPAAFATGCTTDAMPGDDLSEADQAFTGNWNYSWGDTTYSYATIGTSVNRTCFMSGLAGNLIPGYIGQTGAGVTIDGQGNYRIYVDADGGELNVFARCVNTSAGRTAEVTWNTTQGAQLLAPVAPGRRCFLTSVTTSNAYPSLGGHGFKSNSDYVHVWDDGANWYVGGEQSGMVWATARCINVTAGEGLWKITTADPGSKVVPLTNVGGATCLLTGIGGHFTHDDWSDGAFVSFDAGINQFNMNTENGHTVWVNCVR